VSASSTDVASAARRRNSGRDVAVAARAEFRAKSVRE
jgi:hypothetical protein